MHSSVLPAIKAVTDAADFSQTVRPYLPQLYALPQLIYNALLSSDKLNELRILYLSTNPLIFVLALSLFLSPVFLIVSEINKNYSQVDRAWSILPSVYIAHYSFWAHQHGLPTQRLDNILLFAVTWSVRLTYNYWRRGGYSVGSEDYRWEHIKKFLSPTGMFLFNMTFISFTQSVCVHSSCFHVTSMLNGSQLLLFLLTTPVYVELLVSRLTQERMNLTDIVFHRALFVLILIEFVADQQQWSKYLSFCP